MESIDTFIFHKDWIDDIKSYPQDQQDKILAEIARCGTGCELLYKDDPTISAYVNIVSRLIEKSQNKYINKVEQGKTGGRPPTLDNNRILELAREGYSAKAIAAELNCSVNSIYKSAGWENRKKVDEL